MKLKFNVRTDAIGKAIEVNDKYLIDLPSGVIYYNDEYTGNRAKDFPQYLFAIQSLLIQLGVVGDNKDS